MPIDPEMVRTFITATNLPMKEAVALWRGKTPLSQAELDAKIKVNHDRSFAVAGITDADMLQRVYDEMGRALQEGIDFRKFKKSLADVWDNAGFTGKKAWRVENVFRTNMQSAYAAGRYQQMQRVAKRRPYWRYRAVGDIRTRPSHLTMNGKVFAADDPIWQVWYPPNGYMCRCGVQSLSQRQVGKLGIDVLKGTTIIQLPDSGFRRLPYASLLSALTPREMDIVGKSGSTRDANYLPASEIPRGNILPIKPGDILPGGKSEEYYLKMFFDEFGFDSEAGGFVTLPHLDRTIAISKELFVDRKTGKLKIVKRERERYLKLLAETIKNPYEIWSDDEELRDGRIRSIIKFIRIFRGDDGEIGGFAMFQLDSMRGWTGVTTYVPGADDKKKRLLEAIDNKRKGKTLIYREGNKTPE